MTNEQHDTGKRSAVRNNSGQPVDDSGPGLRVGPTTSATAGRNPEACPPNSISQHKSRWESEGEALSSASETSAVNASERGSSLLDYSKSNRNNQIIDADEALKSVQWRRRKSYCGRCTLRGDFQHGSRYIRLDCKTWTCLYCGARKAKRYKWRIREIAEKYRLNRFLTLTLDPQRIAGEDSVRYLRKVFNKFRIYLRRKFGCSLSYLAVLEFHKSGIAHLHVLVDRFIPQWWISSCWNALGGGKVVDIKFVDVHRIGRYLSKYLTKELLLSAPARSRRVTVSRSIRLNEEKPGSDGCWTLLPGNIFFWHHVHADEAQEIKIDPEGFLFRFSLLPNSPNLEITTLTLEVKIYGGFLAVLIVW